MTDSLTRADIAQKITKTMGLALSTSSNIVDSIITEMSNVIVNDGILKISSFGTFNVKHKSARKGRNPRTNEEVTIAARDVVVLSPSRLLTKSINN